MHKDRQELRTMAQKRMRVCKEYKQISQDHLFLDGPVPYLGNQKYLKELMRIIKTSEGSSTLITGFGTVGKSALALNAVDQLNRESAQVNSTMRYINVNVKVIRPESVGHILKMILQQLYDTLRNHPVWNEMSYELRKSLQEAYERLHASVKETNSANAEVKLNMGSSTNEKNSFNAGMGAKNEQTYSYDKLDVAGMTTHINSFLAGFRKAHKFHRVVIIIEELDKLPNTEEGFQFLGIVLRELKELICAPSAHYIIIGGISIYRWMEKKHLKIDSVPKNLFQHQLYLPCLTGSVDELFKLIEDKTKTCLPIPEEYHYMVEKKSSGKLREPFLEIGQYLLFQGTGLPGRVLGCFHEFIELGKKGQYFILNVEQIQNICSTLSVMDHFSEHLDAINHMKGFDRDIHFFMFTSILGYFKLYQDQSVTESELWEAIGPENFNDNTYYKGILQKELRFLTYNSKAGQKSAGILRKHSGKYTLKVNLFSDEEQFCPDDAGQRFDSCVKSMQSNEAKQFWSQYAPVRIIDETSHDILFEVQKKGTNDLYDARFYMTEVNFNWFPAVKTVVHPCLRDTVYISESGKTSSALYEKETGTPLDQLISAKLRKATILQIMEQLLSLIEALHQQGYSNINLAPENILIHADGRIQLRRLENRMAASKKIIPITTSPYSAPEVYSGAPCNASDYHFAALLFLAMLQGEDLRESFHSRHIYAEDLNLDPKNAIRDLLKILSQGKLRKFLTEATNAELSERLSNTADFSEKLRQYMHSIGTAKTDLPASLAYVKGCVQVKIFTPGQAAGQDSTASLNFQGPAEPVSKAANNPCGGIPAQAPDPSRPHLLRVKTAEKIDLSGAMFRVGRAGDMDLRLSGAQIAMVHADLLSIGGKFLIASYSHTYLNSEPLDPAREYVIKDGDRIRFGDDDEYEFHESSLTSPDP